MSSKTLGADQKSTSPSLQTKRATLSRGLRCALRYLVWGAVINFAVTAVAIATWSPTQENVEFYSPPPYDRVFSRANQWGFERTRLMPDSVRIGQMYADLSFANQPEWRQLHLKAGPPFTQFVDSAGFPFRWIYCEWISDSESPTVTELRSGSWLKLRRGISLANADRAAMRMTDNWLAIPLAIIPLGLIGNLAIFGVFAVLVNLCVEKIRSLLGPRLSTKSLHNRTTHRPER